MSRDRGACTARPDPRLARQPDRRGRRRARVRRAWAARPFPSGASTGVHEAVELRDGERAPMAARASPQAVANVDGEIAAALGGLDAADQRGARRRA